MKKILFKFKNFEIDKLQLKKEIGDDLYNVDCQKPFVINKEDLSKAIQRFMDTEISLEQLVDWVNVVWFTDLFEFPEDESDSMVSVLEVLETLDEDNISISKEEFSKMLDALSNNSIYI